jgi:superfamily II DNA or RNA helicase
MGTSVVISSAVSEYRRLCPGAPAIAFCVDIAHSQSVTRAFVDDGWRAAHLDGTTPRDERQAMIAALAGGELDVISNCGLISEGVDVPAVVAAILLRPTLSRALYLQQVGRALRPGKPKALILDHAGCIARHGLPDEDYPWSLEGRDKGSSVQGGRQCEGCGAFNPPTARLCSECGAALLAADPPEPSSGAGKIRLERASVLSEIDAADEAAWLAAASYDTAIHWAGHDQARLRLVARARGYKPGWVYYRLKEGNHVT